MVGFTETTLINYYFLVRNLTNVMTNRNLSELEYVYVFFTIHNIFIGSA
jgi:hypothetical protein